MVTLILLPISLGESYVDLDNLLTFGDVFKRINAIITADTVGYRNVNFTFALLA